MRSSGRPDERLVDQRGVRPRQHVRVVAAVDRTLAHDRIAEVGEVGVVELQVPAAGGVEGGDLVPIARRQVGEELVQVRVGLDVDGRSPAAEVDHRRRRDADLWRRRGHRREVLEVGDLDRTGVAQRTRHRQLRRRHVHGVGGVGARRDVAGDGHAVELLEEVEVEPGAAELTVGDRPHPGVLELAHGIGDRRILDGAQLGCARSRRSPAGCARRGPRVGAAGSRRDRHGTVDRCWPLLPIMPAVC